MNIVVTGCSKGIGYELVKLLAENHKVYGISRDLRKLKELKSSLSNPKNFQFISEDVSKISLDSVNNFVESEKVDLLINNAGVLVNKTFSKISYEDYRSVMDVNFWGAFNLTQLLLDKLSKAKGQVINISSMGGVNYSSKFPGLSLYSSSKAAVSILTECLAVELEQFEINVNAFALGAVQTEMLNDAFPEYKANISAIEMATFIVNFIDSSKNLVNGQVFRIANSNP